MTLGAKAKHYSNRRKLRRMLRRYGLSHAKFIEIAAHKTGCPLAYVAAMIQQESNGRNIFGCDYGPTGGYPPFCNEAVTKERVRALEAAGRPNGIGPAQLTSFGYVHEADAMGGSWKPRINIHVGARIVKDLISRYGAVNGLNAYNGDPTGAYGRRVYASSRVWQSRINATI